MTKQQQAKAKRILDCCPVRTVLQMVQIVGKKAIDRIFIHMAVRTEGRDFREAMKNMENKIRRLPEYKIRFNKYFHQKRIKIPKSKYWRQPKKPYQRKTDELLKK